MGGVREMKAIMLILRPQECLNLLNASCYSEDRIYRYLNFKHSPDNVGYAWHVN